MSMHDDVCRSNTGPAIKWDWLGKYQPYTIRPFNSHSSNFNELCTKQEKSRGIHNLHAWVLNGGGLIFERKI